MSLRRGAPRCIFTATGMLLASLCAARAYEFSTSESGIPLRWVPSPDPIPYSIDRRAVEWCADGSDVEAIQSAFGAWERVSTASVRFRYAGPAREGDADEGASIVIWMKDEWPYDSRFVAKTRLYYRPEEGVIVRAEILLNGRDYRWSADGRPDTLDILNAATHEVGHLLGLGHVHSEGQTMSEYIRLEEREKGVLSDDEIEGLRAAYPRLSPDDELLLGPFSLDYGGASLRPAGAGVPLKGGGIFAALCPLPGSGPGIVVSSGDSFSLLCPAEGGSAARALPVLAGGLNPGRIRAVSSLPPAGAGGHARLAAVVSTLDGTALALGAIPSPPGAVSMTIRPLAGADDVVFFAPLGSDEEGFENSFATIEKRRGSEFYLSIARIAPAGGDGGDIALSPLRSWTLPDCGEAAGLAVLEGGGGQREIAVLARGAGGGLEMLFYSSPFAFLPADGAPLEPSLRLDASALRGAADPLGIAGLPPDGSGRRRIAALIVR